MVSYEYSGGAVRLGRALYVERRADSAFQTGLVNRRDVFIITAPRQTGKTSLWYSARRSLKELNRNAELIDFREVLGLPEEHTLTAKGWTEAILRGVARAFRINQPLLLQWLRENEYLSSTDLIVSFFAEFLREALTGPIVVAFDEIDIVQLYSHYTDNLFYAIRSLAPKRDELDISFVLIGLNHPRDLIKTDPASGFNIGGHTALDDFDPDDSGTVEAWAEGYEADEKDRLQIAHAILAATGGQPYLTAWLFEQARKNSVKKVADVAPIVEGLIDDVRNDEGPATHFHAAGDIILNRPNLAFRIVEAIEKAREGAVPLTDVTPGLHSALISTGLVRERNRSFVIKSPIYQAYFDTEWCRDLKRKIGGAVFSDVSVPIAKGVPRKRVCIINTGGMISMELRQDGKIDRPHDLSAFFRRFPELSVIANYDAVPLMFKDSSDMNPDDWSLIAEAIYQRRDDCDGFVVVHGTDTLPHTASAVAYALGENLNFPVVFVGSQTAPHVIHGDARINLMRACTVATLDNIPEVVAVVGDHIHRAVRVQKKDDYRFEGMHSPTLEPIGIIADTIEIKQGAVRKSPKLRDIELRNEFSHNVFKVGLYPGLDPGFLNPVLENPKVEGVIIETLGIGNVPVEGKWSLLPFIEKASRANIPVLLASQFPIQPEMTAKYQPASAPLAAGAIGAANMAPPAAVTKFMWVLPQIRQGIESGTIRPDKKLDQVARWMNRDFVGEVETPSSDRK
jgi:L-asparaginase